jgi:hypothetical protein
MKLLNFDRRDCETLLPVGIFLALIVVIGLFVHFDVLEPQAVQMHDQFLSTSTSLPTGSEIEVGAYIDITGYKTIDFNIFTNIHEYGSDFGLKKINPKHVHTNQVVFETSYKPSVNAALLALFFPYLL